MLASWSTLSKSTANTSQPLSGCILMRLNLATTTKQFDLLAGLEGKWTWKARIRTAEFVAVSQACRAIRTGFTDGVDWFIARTYRKLVSAKNKQGCIRLCVIYACHTGYWRPRYLILRIHSTRKPYQGDALFIKSQGTLLFSRHDTLHFYVGRRLGRITVNGHGKQESVRQNLWQ